LAFIRMIPSGIVGTALLAFGLIKAGSIGGTVMAFSLAVGPALAPSAAWGLVILEITLGAFVLSGWRERAMSTLAGLMGVAFVGWSVWMSLVHPGHDCGCGRVSWTMLGLGGSAGSIVRSACFAGLALLAFVATGGDRHQLGRRERRGA
jgi:hypothetical protein